MKELIQLRKELHQYPEISGNEKETAKRILTFLSHYSPDTIITKLGGEGILATYNGKEKGKTILFRCELDALPIHEINSFSHQSVYEDVSHKCGHDGHMAILCGLAKELYQNPIEKGTVLLLFQPAEEDGNGARRVSNDKKFKEIKPDYAFALHNLPGFKKRQIIVKEHTFTCAVNSMIIKLRGKTSHAGEPENGINPALAISEIINRFDAIIKNDVTQPDYCLITPIYINMGEKAYGVSAGYGEIHFTIRSNSNLQMRTIETHLESIIQSIASKHKLELNIDWTQSFQANENNVEAINIIREAASKNRFDILEKEEPFTFGEDFGLFTQKFKGAMLGLGSGEKTPSLHNPDYDFPDEIIETGIKLFHQITKDILNA
ncbi:amidohydrolase [Flavobacterium sp. 316]|uniref:amidohydrolase n=1 Tax=Flavobacterium sp. 316 TaxID=1603293 RepID=UPI0005DF3163|nr:amidohydrolase [Flavobacterium sp. 316]KIX20405.1 amidohydrolase [Flavobacterium sp. 316]